MLLAQRVRPGPCGDFRDLGPLASAAHSVMAFDPLIANGGYDSEANHRYCREGLGIESLIPAKKRWSATVVATTPLRREMRRRLGDPGDAESRRARGQRWKVETIMTVTSAVSVRHRPPAATRPSKRRSCYGASPTTSTALPCSGSPHKPFDRAGRSKCTYSLRFPGETS
ncbi:MAG TPA: hypothetical protein VEY95_14315 [Azospirillaceae bacterium]|nr:hypothetical protein [Azospirillaceae bacterium]